MRLELPHRKHRLFPFDLAGYYNVVNCYAENLGKDYKVVNRRHVFCAEPVVDCLHIGEVEYNLQLSGRNSPLLHECLDSCACGFQVKDRL